MTLAEALHAAVRDNRSIQRPKGPLVTPTLVRRFNDDGSFVRSELVADGKVYTPTKDDEKATDWDVR